MKKTSAIPIAILAGGAIVATALYFSLAEKRPSSGTHLSAIRAVSDTDHLLGNPLAPVKIITYSDFDCPFCKELDLTLRQIAADYGPRGDVALVYRHLPITELHPNALRHSEAAECVAQAGGNDAFWKFAAILFQNQPAETGSYGAFALSAGADTALFATCMQEASKRVRGRIDADRKNAKDIGARGTPFTVIQADGLPPVAFSGAYPYSVFKDAVDAALSQL